MNTDNISVKINLLIISVIDIIFKKLCIIMQDKKKS